MKISFTRKSLAKFSKESSKEQMISSIHGVIKYCRHLEKEKLEGKRENGGHEALTDISQYGGMNQELHDKIKEAIDNPEMLYEIIILDVNE